MKNRFSSLTLTGLLFVSVMVVKGMDIEVLDKKTDIIVAITTQSKALGRTVNRYVFADENRKKCAQFGWTYGADDILIEVSISCKNPNSQIIDCLKDNPLWLRKALLKNLLNDTLKHSTLSNDLRTPQFPRYIPLHILTAQDELILEMYGCRVKAEIIFTDDLENDTSTSLKKILCLAAGGFGFAAIGCLLLLENMKLLGA